MLWKDNEKYEKNLHHINVNHFTEGTTKYLNHYRLYDRKMSIHLSVVFFIYF